MGLERGLECGDCPNAHRRGRRREGNDVNGGLPPHANDTYLRMVCGDVAVILRCGYFAGRRGACGGADI